MVKEVRNIILQMLVEVVMMIMIMLEYRNTMLMDMI